MTNLETFAAVTCPLFPLLQKCLERIVSMVLFAHCYKQLTVSMVLFAHCYKQLTVSMVLFAPCYKLLAARLAAVCKSRHSAQRAALQQSKTLKCEQRAALYRGCCAVAVLRGCCAQVASRLNFYCWSVQIFSILNKIINFHFL